MKKVLMMGRAITARTSIGIATLPPNPNNGISTRSQRHSASSLFNIQLSVPLHEPVPQDRTVHENSDEIVVGGQQTDTPSGPEIIRSMSITRVLPKVPMLMIGRGKFRVLWYTTIVLHSITGSSLLFTGFLYLFLYTNRKMDYILSMLIRTPLPLFPFISILYILIGSTHMIAIINMLWASYCDHQLSFYSHRLRTWKEVIYNLLHGPPLPSSTNVLSEPRHPSLELNPSNAHTQTWIRSHYLFRKCGSILLYGLEAYESLLGLNGVFGLNTEYFDLVFFIRWFLLIGMQTYHTYLTSYYVSSHSLNNLAVLALVIHCWSTPMIHLYCQQVHGGVAFERVLYLVICSCTLFITYILILILLCYPYLLLYNTSHQDFPYDMYYNEVWLMKLVKEMQLLIIGGIGDGFVTFLPLATLSICLSSIKPILESRTRAVMDGSFINGPNSQVLPRQTYTTVPSQSIQHNEQMQRQTVDDMSGIDARVIHGEGSTHSSDSEIENERRHRLRIKRQLGFNRAIQPATIRDKGSHRTPTFQSQTHPIQGTIATGLNIFFFLWGVAVIAFHLRALSVSQAHIQDGCLLEARPWSTSRYGCSVFEYNCWNRPGSTGSSNELDTVFLTLHRPSLTALIISHCPGVVVPSSITLFLSLYGIKLYNTTLMSWSKDSALTQTHHPRLHYVYMVRTNFTNIDLAFEGLMSSDIPTKLHDIELCQTNLTLSPEIESLLAVRWSRIEYLLIEESKLTTYPTFLTNLPFLHTVSVAWNDLALLPDNVVNEHVIGLHQLSISGNPKVEMIPASVWNSSLVLIEAYKTGLKTLRPSESTTMVVRAAGTPLCEAQISISQVINSLQCVIASGDDTTVTKPGLLYPLSVEDGWRLQHVLST